MMITEKGWIEQYETVRRLLQQFMKVHSNGQHVPQVIECLRYWEAVRSGTESLPCRAIPVLVGVSGRVRSCLFGAFLATLRLNIEYKDQQKVNSFVAILENNCDRSLAVWPLINLVDGDDRVSCTGFRNKRVHGGDMTRWDYYYYPDWFTETYGRDAAKREAEVRV